MKGSYPELRLFVAGKWISSDGRDTIAVEDPGTGDVLGHLPRATQQDLSAAIEAVHETAAEWGETSPIARAQILREAAESIRRRASDFAHVITLELGKPLPESLREIERAAEIFEWSAEEGRRAYGRVIPSRVAGRRQLAVMEPVGPVAAFSGWNAPAITPARKISSALAAGCPIIIKPAEETPATALMIAEALEQAGLPPGVLNMVFGDPAEISRALCESPAIRMVTFTGSTQVGRQIGEYAARGFKRALLELGGHAPVLVFDDANIADAATQLAAAKFRNSGQVCTSPTRIYVQQSSFDEFAERFAAIARHLRVGYGTEDGIGMGPLANSRRLHAMEEMTEDGRRHGLAVIAGGRRIERDGYYWEPTVLKGASDDCMAANVEPFGPLALLQPFSTLDDAIAKANRLPFGLAAYAFTNSISTARTVGSRIRSGVVCINHCEASLPETPFGGVRDSGLGTEGGIEGLQAFLQTKFISEA